MIGRRVVRRPQRRAPARDRRQIKRFATGFDDDDDDEISLDKKKHSPNAEEVASSSPETRDAGSLTLGSFSTREWGREPEEENLPLEA